MVRKGNHSKMRVIRKQNSSIFVSASFKTEEQAEEPNNTSEVSNLRNPQSRQQFNQQRVKPERKHRQYYHRTPQPRDPPDQEQTLPVEKPQFDRNFQKGNYFQRKTQPQAVKQPQGVKPPNAEQNQKKEAPPDKQQIRVFKKSKKVEQPQTKIQEQNQDQMKTILARNKQFVPINVQLPKRVTFNLGMDESTQIKKNRKNADKRNNVAPSDSEAHVNKLRYECRFCKNNPTLRKYRRSHEMLYWDGSVQCWFLRSVVCPLCKATGDLAHTRKHCPQLHPYVAK